MGLIKPIVMAFCMFSRIPMPRIDWDEKGMRYMMCAFPLVGVAIAVCLAAWWALCDWLMWGPFIRAAGIALIPIGVSGGIHLDGLTDVVDALSSCAEPERKREILKDSHIGAFAAMGVAVYSIAYLAIATEIQVAWSTLILLGFLHVQSRLASSFSTLCLKGSSNEGMLASFRNAGSGNRGALLILAIEEIGCLAVAVYANPVSGAVMLLGCLCCVALTVRMARREFGGMSGDIAGFMLQMCEVTMLACLVVSQSVMALC